MTRSRLLAAVGLLAVVVVLELVAGPALRPAPPAAGGGAVLAIPGVAAMIQRAQADPTEITHVAAAAHPYAPLALSANAALDALLLLAVVTGGLARLLADRNVTRSVRNVSFAGSFAVLLAAMVVAVGAIGRLRYLAALYLSAPVGTLSYLLLYGTFSRPRSLFVLSVLLALKVAACLALYVGAGGPRAPATGAVAGLALTSLAASVVTAVCYSWAPVTLAPITDAVAAATVALAAVVWAAVFVSNTMRRLT
ncbi:MAG: hypothetical protein QOK39_1749 [Acidimicrobiaceae bacterium]|nr:hypothetical protein [Acidimicrobiaceae bacterium]